MPKIIKTVKKWGGSLVIRFNPEEVKSFNLSKDKRIIISIEEVENGAT